MNETHWFHVSISCWRLETTSTNVHKTPVECFEYTVAPSDITGGLSQGGKLGWRGPTG